MLKYWDWCIVLTRSIILNVLIVKYSSIMCWSIVYIMIYLENLKLTLKFKVIPSGLRSN